jgi:serine/threonine protein kinase
LIGSNGYAKLADFGLAKLVGRGARDLTESGMATRNTRAGVVVGTIAYMSPEQAAGQELDARNDIFSFGIVLYEMLAGRHPFLRESPAETLSAILRDEPPPAPWLPASLEDVLGRCLAKSADERWSTVEALERALRGASSRGGVLGALRGWLRRS